MRERRGGGIKLLKVIFFIPILGNSSDVNKNKIIMLYSSWLRHLVSKEPE